MLGGIGFTWEHDAHFYLRRAMATRQLLGGVAPVEEGGRAAPRSAGRDAHLTLDLPEEADGHPRRRREVRRRDRGAAQGRTARPRVVDNGYFVPHWDEPWGRNAQAVEQLVIDEEFTRTQDPSAASPDRRVGGADHRRARHARTAGALGAPDADGRDQLVPAVQRARGGQRPRRAHHLAPRRPTAAGCSTARRCGRQLRQGSRLGHVHRAHQPDGGQAPRHHLHDRGHEDRRASTSVRSKR